MAPLPRVLAQSEREGACTGGALRGKSKSNLKGLFLYTVNFLFYVECCIRQLWCSSTVLYSITSIAYNYHTDI